MPYSAIVVFSDPVGSVLGWSDQASFSGHAGNLRDDVVVEHFQVRINDAGVAQWLNVRPRLRTLGFPDRPPDVDTPDTRVWLRHPGEVGQFFDDQDSSALEMGEVFFVLALSRALVTGELLHMLVVGQPDGVYLWSLAVESEDGTKTVDQSFRSELSTPDEAVWGAIEDMLVFIAEFSVPDKATPVFTTYVDGQFVESEILLAKADLDRGFISPLGDAKA